MQTHTYTWRCAKHTMYYYGQQSCRHSTVEYLQSEESLKVQPERSLCLIELIKRYWHVLRLSAFDESTACKQFSV